MHQHSSLKGTEFIEDRLGTLS